MSTPQLPTDPRARIARQAREQFVKHAQGCIAPMLQVIRTRLSELAQVGAPAREMQERRDAMMDFESKGVAWAQGTGNAWQKAVVPPAAAARVRMRSAGLELISDEVVERKILSSRLAQAISEKSSWELNDLRVRMQYLEGEDELPEADVLRPESLCQILVEQWGGAGLSPESWQLAQDVIQRSLLEHLPESYRLTNEYLVKENVLRDIDLSKRVKRGSSQPSSRKADADSAPAALAGKDGADIGPNARGGHRAGGVSGGAGHPVQGGHDDRRNARQQSEAGQGRGGGQTGQASSPQGGHQDRQGGPAWRGDDGGAPPSDSRAGRGNRDSASARSVPGGVADETRLMTSNPPLSRARARATGVLGQLRRLLTDRVAGFDGASPMRPSPALAEALTQQVTQVQNTGSQPAGSSREPAVYDNVAVQEVAVDLRRRTSELKKKAATSGEKATIEIVALMFQSILAEERIPPGVRVWFARLQMPVLRVAIAEPEFFGSLEHPARQLIDRMGSCVMGFDAAAITGGALEVEIKRVVQVIEQYPDTGRRVFQLVYDEFKKFLSRFLTEHAQTQRLVSVAQQVEQKETMAVQYTIEMRSMLADMPVRDEVREFLFKVWAEVLAVAAVKNGPQHEETLALKKSATDLIWAASAKPNRVERARVIQDLPHLLQRLRQGMSLVGIQGSAQEAHIKTIGDTLADAFQSKTEAIPQAQIEAMAKRLAHLEDFVANDPETDLPLDSESIELMLGIDASMIEVIANGGSQPNSAMLAWAAELQLGNWFALDHNGATTQVQYAWQSERKQLHLFAAPGSRSYLIQARRLAAYLQAGLLVPAEEEGLTVRATRDALAKLDANPERLLR